MVLWSFLSVGLFFFFANKISGQLEPNLVTFSIILLGYALICFVMTSVFSHRLIGPFERLKTELRLIIAGDYSRRLKIREKDDIYIRSFIKEVNRLIEEHERLRKFSDEFYHEVLSGLSELIYRIEKERECPLETKKELLLNIHKKLTELKKTYNIKL
ncbi:MAG: hypothetical protein D6710_01165 [Nitrospirae bacterium]|nr:MAG: hypothetical protein D6710_01165 [Nitrospirota bacterium]